MGRLGRRYEPVSFVTVLRLIPVFVCVTVTCTPGKTAPLGSLTEPLICAVACAHTAGTAAESRHVKKTLVKTNFPKRVGLRLFFTVPPFSKPSPQKGATANSANGSIYDLI